MLGAMTTDITVRGQAHDTRDPDRAVLTIVVRAEARDWAEAHVGVSSAIATLNDSIAALQATQPDALERFNIGQTFQTSWTVKGGQKFVEMAHVTMRFIDFSAMSIWAFGNTSEAVQIQGISWELSPRVRDAVRTELGKAAVQDARDRATTFAAAAGLKIVAVQALADPGLLTGGQHGGMGDQIYAAVPRGMAFAASGAISDQVIDLTPEPIETTSLVEAHFLAE